MKRIVKTFIAVSVAAAMAIPFAGCQTTPEIEDAVNNVTTGEVAEAYAEVNTSTAGFSDDTSVPKHLAVVLGKRANSPIPDLNVLFGMIKKVYSSGGTVDVVVVDGRPVANLSHHDVDEPDTSLSKSNMTRKIESDSKKLLTSIYGEQPLTEEADTLGAINVASEKLRSYDGEKCMMIFDSGIPTKGGFWLNTFIGADVDQIMTNLKNNKSISSYDGFKIFWYCFAAAEQDQKDPSDLDKSKLEETWRRIFKEGGASEDDIVIEHTGLLALDSQAKAEIIEKFPKVSSVEVSPTTQLFDPNFTPEKVAEVLDEGGIQLSEENVQFVADRYELADREKVKKELDSLAQALKAHPEVNIAIIGSTASVGDAKGAQEFGRNRANTIKDVLSELGVSKSQMVIGGAGFSDPSLHYPDIDSSTGELIPENAQKNRCVYIMSTDDPRAEPYL